MESAPLNVPPLIMLWLYEISPPKVPLKMIPPPRWFCTLALNVPVPSMVPPLLTPTLNVPPVIVPELSTELLLPPSLNVPPEMVPVLALFT